MRIPVAAFALGSAAAVWTAHAGQVYQKADPGSGVVTVAGTVAVGNTPSVRASQLGDWKVALADVADVRVANSPTVTMTAPGFLQSGNRYDVIWPNGDRETVVVEQIGGAGWVRVDGRRWINAAAARSFESKP